MATLPNSREREQQGIALIFVLLMLAITTSMALITARITLLGDQASRNDRDREIAFQAAELALNDAELDIMDVSIATGRACKFGNASASFVADPGCSVDTARRGICGANPSNPTTAFYKMLDWEETDDAKRAYVKFGEFTNRSAQLSTGSGTASAKPPKYIVVQSPVQPQILIGTDQVFKIESAYRIYAVGYGANAQTQVLLESEIYKPIVDKNCFAPAPAPAL